MIHPNPYQPRTHFDADKIAELAQSIREHGVFTPILVRKAVSGFQLIAGERRLRAAKEAGLDMIPAIVLEFDDQQMMEVSLIENIQREDLNIVEEARAYQTLIEKLNLTQEDFKDFICALPFSFDEQNEIVNYLDEKTSKIDSIIEVIGKKIEVLKEFRKTLINDVVTGKVMVA